jgi:putative endopeptidase
MQARIKSFIFMKQIMACMLFFALLAGCNNSGKNTGSMERKYPAFDVQNMDTSVQPGDDFFVYVNGSWLKNNPIPADKNSTSAFDELLDRNRNDIKGIIEAAAAQKNAQPGSVAEKIGLFYNSGMDSLAIDEQGANPLKPYFDKIAGMKTVADVQAVAAYFQTYQVNPFFFLFSNSDAKNSESVIANTYQAGIGLPDRDYYFNTDESTVKIRQQYLVHVAKMFELLKDEPGVARKNAETIMKIETRFAKASFTRVENQDPQKTYNKYDLDGLNKLAPNIDWAGYFTSIGYPGITEVNVYQPGFLKELSSMLKTIPVSDWKTFFRWNLINTSAAYLSSDFANQNFDFYYKTLSGQEQMEPRWKLVLDVTSSSLGEAIGQLYVEKFFPAEAKQKMIDLVSNLKKSLKMRIENLAWMGPQTKLEAVAKLDKIAVKVGYPDVWRDYSGLTVSAQPYVLNLFNSSNFEFRYSMDKIGKPVDRTAWGMTPQTVNAYYDPGKNEIVFPAGILQPPFFNLYADDAINYGGIGLVIGHEMTHGFDNMGRQYDKDGNLRDWWTKEDSKAFEEHTNLLVDQYNQYEVLDSVFVNGKLTLGENIADLGGATVAYNAYRLSLDGKEEPKPIDGFTHYQRFFLAYAQIWRTNMRDEALRKKVKTNEHAPEKTRVNGVVYNMPEFYAAFPGIMHDDKLYRPVEQRPVIW